MNGAPGGVPGLGLVAATSPIEATYTAPATKPRPNRVAVSAQVVQGARKNIVFSYVTIVDDQWVGTGESSSAAISVRAQVTWKLESYVGNIATYLPSGTASVVVHGCLRFTPDNGVIDPSFGGVLFVDYNSSPPSYHGSGLALWPAIATSTCPNPPPPLSTFAPAAFFGGSKGVEAQGQVSADGMTIEGTDTNTLGSEPVTFKWNFSRR